jgi:alanyl-tRNA synthetase
MALFGEKYGEIVRTVAVGGDPGDSAYSFELCGGLHVSETGEIGQFRFVSEEAVGAGTRRVEALTGRSANRYVAERLELLDRLAQRLNAPLPEIENRLEALQGDHKSLSRELEQINRRMAREQFESLLGQIKQVNGANLLAAQVEVSGIDGLREMVDWYRDKVGSGAAVLATVSNGKPVIVAAVSDDLIARGLKAGDLAREVAAMVGGSGGGRPNMAQAGGRDPEKLSEALAKVEALVAAALKE